MWNSFNTGDYSGMIAETISLAGHGGKNIRAYYSRPITDKATPGIVLIPHMPGWDEWCRETCRRFTEHGYSVLCPDIYQDFGTGTPPEVSKRMWEAGGALDSSVMEDTAGCLDFLKSKPGSNGKVGVIGMCSGGRHAFLASKDQLTPARPVSPIDYTEQLEIPLLGIFGNDDHNPTREDVNILEERLKAAGKDYEFHRYEGAGHGIWYYDKPMYRQEAAMDSFNKTLEFFDRHLK